MAKTQHELRCTCRFSPKLAEYGIDEKGVPYVHVKVWKGRRLYTEVIFTGGIARIFCRDCSRWYRVVFRERQTTLVQVARPREVAG